MPDGVYEGVISHVSHGEYGTEGHYVQVVFWRGNANFS